MFNYVLTTCSTYLMKWFLSILKEFVTLAKELKECPSLCHYITTNAKKCVSEHHSIEGEKNTYKWLVDKLVPHWQLD